MFYDPFVCITACITFQDQVMMSHHTCLITSLCCCWRGQQTLLFLWLIKDQTKAPNTFLSNSIEYQHQTCRNGAENQVWRHSVPFSSLCWAFPVTAWAYYTFKHLVNTGGFLPERIFTSCGTLQSLNLMRFFSLNVISDHVKLCTCLHSITIIRVLHRLLQKTHTYISRTFNLLMLWFNWSLFYLRLFKLKPFCSRVFCHLPPNLLNPPRSPILMRRKREMTRIEGWCSQRFLSMGCG